MTSAPWQQRPESKGYVRIKSSDPFEQPEIQPRYLTEEADRRVLVAAMRLARNLLISEPLAPYYDYEDFPARCADRRRTARRRERAWHDHVPSDGHLPHGAANDPTSVVDDELRVRGLEACASSMPRSCR